MPAVRSYNLGQKSDQVAQTKAASRRSDGEIRGLTRVSHTRKKQPGGSPRFQKSGNEGMFDARRDQATRAGPVDHTPGIKSLLGLVRSSGPESKDGCGRHCLHDIGYWKESVGRLDPSWRIENDIGRRGLSLHSVPPVFWCTPPMQEIIRDWNHLLSTHVHQNWGHGPQKNSKVNSTTFETDQPTAVDNLSTDMLTFSYPLPTPPSSCQYPKPPISKGPVSQPSSSTQDPLNPAKRSQTLLLRLKDRR
jgi:hypothetical protein